MKFGWAQIPLVLLFAFSSVMFYIAFSDSKTSFYESTARQITRVASKSNNGQLTADFYPDTRGAEENQPYLSKLITDTKNFNRTKYIYYRTNGHKVRVIANGEGKKDYWFPALQSSPTFIVENTFSLAWGEEHLYENYNINIMNETNIYGIDKNKHFFINETDAKFLINNNENFYGLTISEVAGKTLELHYFDDKGIEQSEDWTISNIIVANQLDDQLYKSLYKSYVICSSYLPSIHNKICIAFDFSSNETDNTHCLNDAATKYANYQMVFDSRNFKNPDNYELTKIIDNFYAISKKQNNDNTTIVVIMISILAISAAIFVWCLKFRISPLSTSILLVISFAIIYTVFMICCKVFPFGIMDKSFNTFSIITNIFYIIFSIVAIILADNPKGKSDSKSCQNEEELNEKK